MNTFKDYYRQKQVLEDHQIDIKRRYFVVYGEFKLGPFKQRQKAIDSAARLRTQGFPNAKVVRIGK